MANPNIDYATTNFEYPVLTKVHGIPAYESMKIIKNELKANAASVPCDLGGGANGHLGIMLTQPEYANVSAVDYVRPVHPGILCIPHGTTIFETTRLTNEHKEHLRLNREANNVEACLLKQLGKALPELYLKSFRNEYSNTFTTGLQTILQYLFTTYGFITPEELKEQEDALTTKVFDIQQPLIILFNELEDLEQVAIAASNPYTGTQLVNVGIKLIKNFNDFEKGLTSWFERPLAQHTIPNFKTHFEREYVALKRVRGTTMRNTAYFQQANAITTVLESMKQERLEMIQEVKNSETKIMRAMQMTQDHFVQISEQGDNVEIKEEPMQKANSVSTDMVQLEILKLLKEMKEENKKTWKKNKNSNQNNNNNNANTNNNKNNNRNQNQNQNANENQRKKQRRDVSKYCSSCGAGNHIGKNCFKKGPNHKDDATFKNMKGGCTDFCQFVTE